MKKIVFDADGLIKIVRSGLAPQIPHHGFISAVVYEETVVEGKRRLYPDAFVIDQLVYEKKITVHKVKITPGRPQLGSGEMSTLTLFHQVKADFIVSDDRQFLAHLEEQGVPFLVPSELLVFLGLSQRQQRTICLQALERIKELITKENYDSAKAALGG